MMQAAKAAWRVPTIEPPRETWGGVVSGFVLLSLFWGWVPNFVSLWSFFDL